MKQGEIWKCSQCGTMNNGPVCRVCRRDPSGKPVYGINSENYEKQEKTNKILTVVLVVICAAIVVIAGCFVVYFATCNNNTESVEVDQESVNSALESICYVIDSDNDGFSVREKPKKDSDKLYRIDKGDTSKTLRYLGEKVLGDDNWFWFYVETPDGQQGYVKETWVKKSGE